MKVQEVFIKGYLDSYLHVLCVKAKEPIGTLHIIHGMGEHAKRYTHFASFLAENGYNVYMHDHRGHGKSVKANQEVGILDKDDTLFNMVEDILFVKAYIDSKETLPYYILGHSMGSIIVRYLLETHPTIDVKKAIIMGTLPRYPKAQVIAMRTLASLLGLFKSSKVRHQGLAKLLNDGLIKTIENPETDFDWLSYNKTNVHNYVADPLCGYAYNKRFYQSFFKLVDKVNQKKNMKQMKPIPILFIAGEDDPINKKMTAIDKLVKTYQLLNQEQSIMTIGIKDARHELLHEDNHLESYKIIQVFLDN